MEFKQFEKLEERVTSLVGAVKKIKKEKNDLDVKVVELERQVISLNESNKEQLSTFFLEKERFLEEITNLQRERDVIKGKVSVMLEKLDGVEADL